MMQKVVCIRTTEISCALSQERPLNSAENFLAAEKSATMQKRLGRRDQDLKLREAAAESREMQGKKSTSADWIWVELKYCILACSLIRTLSSKIKEHCHLHHEPPYKKVFSWPTFLYYLASEASLEIRWEERVVITCTKCKSNLSLLTHV